MDIIPSTPQVIPNGDVLLEITAVACPRINLTPEVDCKNIEHLQRARDSLMQDGAESEFIFTTPIIGWSLLHTSVLPISPGIGGNDSSRLEDWIWVVSKNGVCFSSPLQPNSMESFIHKAISMIDTRIIELQELMCKQ
jgi:hypothetical protein